MLDEARIEAFIEERRAAGLKTVLGHASYLINLASDNAETRRRSLDAMLREMERCARLGLDFLVIHPGSHMGQGERRGLELMAQGLGEVLGQFPRSGARVLLETTGGQGTSLGCSFEQLAWLLDHTRGAESMGVCFDTAHVFAARVKTRP